MDVADKYVQNMCMLVHCSAFMVYNDWYAVVLVGGALI